jgi:hypothetical protein
MELGKYLVKGKVIIPIIISILSLSFNFYQYFDNKDLKDRNLKLSNTLKELEAIKSKIELRKLELMNYAKLQLNILETHLPDIVLPMKMIPFDEALSEFLSNLEKELPLKSKLVVIKNESYNKLKTYIDQLAYEIRTEKRIEEIAELIGGEPESAKRFAKINSVKLYPALRLLLKKYKLKFLVISNIGGSKATEIESVFKYSDDKEIIRLNSIEPNYSCLYIFSCGDIIDSLEDFYFMDHIQYIDSFTNKKKTVKFNPNAMSVIIKPRLALKD